MKVTHELNKSKGKTFRILCSHCKTDTKHEVLTSVYEVGTEPLGQYVTFDWNTDYEIIKCLGCDTISFRSYGINSEHTDYKNKPISTINIYPKRDKNALIAKDYWHVPSNLEVIYKETISSFNNQNLILSAVGVRAIVEGICTDQEITDGPRNIDDNISEDTPRSRNLQGKINGLYEANKLTKTNAEILHEHRFLGNKAVHELTKPTRDDLELAIEIIENVFENLYEIPKKGLRLRNKRLNT